MRSNKIIIFIVSDEIADRDREITALKNESAQLSGDVARLKTSMKSTNVLNLEMDAYEKSLNEVSLKLETKMGEIADVSIQTWTFSL